MQYSKFFQFRAVVATCIRHNHNIPRERLRNKIAIVTGSTTGIGFAIGKRLAQEGAKVIISSRKQQNVDAAIERIKKENLNMTALVCHVSNQEDRKRLFDKAAEYGGLDILVSNAAVNPVQGDILQYDEDSWNKVFNVNVTSSFLLAKEAYPQLKNKGSGNIVFMASVAAYQTMPVGIGAYAVSKTALLGLTKVLAHEFGKDGIRVNCIAPGIIDTRFGDYITKNAEFNEVLMERSIIKRLGRPEDVSGVVAFLVSDDGQFITGENIVVAAGVQSRL